MPHGNLQISADLAALQFYVDAGLGDVSFDEAVNRYALAEGAPAVVEDARMPAPSVSMRAAEAAPVSSSVPIGRSDAKQEALKLAAAAQTLEELREAVASFEGLALKRTAMNLVFADGNPKAKIMVIGEAPGADEDRQGKPFVGAAGQLLDKILASIGLSREAEEPEKAVYISNILNWRPPGNRTPNEGEIDISLPFIERHIQLIKPEFLILFGGVSGKALLNKSESISRLRGKWQDYKTVSEGLEALNPIPAIATYHPAYLLRTPMQKKAVWADMLALKKRMNDL